MRLLTVGSMPPSWGGKTVGGVANVHASINAEFLRLGPHWNLDLIGVVAANLDSGCVAGLDPARESVLIAPPSGYAGSRLSQWYQELLQEKNPDLVLYHHLAHSLAATHVREVDIPFVGVVHSWHPLTFTKRQDRFQKEAILREVLPAASALIFPSCYTRDEASGLSMPLPSDCFVIGNPVDACFVSQAPVARSPKLKRVAAVGSLTKRKRIDLVLRACSTLGAQLVVAGDGEQRDDLALLAKQLGSDVVFTGNVSPDTLARILADTDAICVPSMSESFGNVYVEALAVGVPVIGFAPTIGEIERAMGMAVGLGVSGESSLGDVTDALRLVLERKWNHAKLASRAAECYSARRIAVRYSEVIHNAAKGRWPATPAS